MSTTEGLAELTVPLTWKPERGAPAGYERVREQARVQVKGRRIGRPVWEALELEADAGLALLPEPTAGDVFFDFEGSPFVGEKGLEYLFGFLTVDEAGQEEHTGLWAVTHKEEKQNFEDFIDWVMARWRRYPAMHVYHFAPYEPSAIKRLMGYHATREEEVDSMLRAGLFVDLYRVVQGGLRASVESYSLKEMERFFEFERSVPLREANSALYRLSACLELGSTEDIAAEDKAVVEGYNRDDCVSTLRLRNWLEAIREEQVQAGANIERPAMKEGEAPERISEWQQKIEELSERITGGKGPGEAEEDKEGQQARGLLANILDWHRREEKPVYWEYYRLNDCKAEELMDERAAFAQLTFVEEEKGGRGRAIQRYRFAAQETDLRGRENLYIPGGEFDRFGEVVSLDGGNSIVEIRKASKARDVHPEALFAHDIVWAGTLKDALVRIGEDVVDIGLGGGGAYRVAGDLLLRRPPRAGGQPLRIEGEKALDAALRIVCRPGFGVLPIQGPPGAGKTYTAARMICRLVANGARVGICAVSHRVIRNLLDDAMEAAHEDGFELRAVRKVGTGESTVSDDSRLTLVNDNGQMFRALDRGCQVGRGYGVVVGQGGGGGQR